MLETKTVCNEFENNFLPFEQEKAEKIQTDAKIPSRKTVSILDESTNVN